MAQHRPRRIPDVVAEVGADLGLGLRLQAAQPLLEGLEQGRLDGLDVRLARRLLHPHQALHLEGQGLLQQGQDALHRLVDPPRPVPLEAADGGVQARLPALVDGLERPQQPDALVVGGAVGIELAHRVEGHVQGVPPGPHVAVHVGLVVEDGHARAGREAQELHLHAVLLLDALGAIHHQDDPRALGHRPQQVAVVGEQGLVLMGRDEGTRQVGQLGVGLEPLQDVARVLEARGVDELQDALPVDDHRIAGAGGGGAGALVDLDAVVLGQGRDHRALARVGVAHDGQDGDRVGHQVASRSKGTSVSRRR